MKVSKEIRCGIEDEILKTLRRSTFNPPKCKYHLETIIVNKHVHWQKSNRGKYFCNEGFKFVHELHKAFNKSFLRLTKAGIVLRCSKYPYTIKLNI